MKRERKLAERMAIRLFYCKLVQVKKAQRFWIFRMLPVSFGLETVFSAFLLELH